jgi:pimeloyl-ACP methyl ester carboxylesterase
VRIVCGRKKPEEDHLSTKRLVLIATAITVLALASMAGSASALKVTWMPGYPAAGTPAKYNKVGVLKVGPSRAKNVLVLEPGTSAGSAYFVPLAQWIVKTVPGWQVWAVERRENLLEDQSELNLAKAGKASGTAVFNYYLGWLTNKKITHHMPAADYGLNLAYAKQWGMNVAVQDLRRVIAAAHKLGGKVVLGGHSLGGSVVTAYATWDFSGKAGADGLAGLLYIDGGSFRNITATQAQSDLSALDADKASPWLSFGGIGAPYAGLFIDTGALGIFLNPNAPSEGQAFKFLPPTLKPKVPVTNEAQFGFALNVGTSPVELAAAQAHLGKGVSSATIGGYHTWNGAGALTPIKRFAQMFSGWGIQNVDGDEWYFPQRLTDDTGAVDNGNANPAQKVLDLDATMGHHLPKNLLIYAFATSLGRTFVINAAKQLAAQSKIPSRNVTLINREHTYAHNDPAGAYPNNVFFTHLVTYLHRVDGH